MNKKKLNYKFHSTNSTRGFVVLYAALLSSIVLAIGMSIYNTTLKDMLFSSSGRESQLAFYATDSGVECALYWDKKYDGGGKVFATSSASVSAGFPSVIISCDDIEVEDWGVSSSLEPSDHAITTFSITTDNVCANIVVTKYASGASIIESRGYNNCKVGDPRRVERGLKVNY